MGNSISKVLVGDQHVFDKATDIILADDAHSLRLRFNVAMGDASESDDREERGMFKLDDKLPEALEMEGQGILVRDNHSGNPTHVLPESLTFADCRLYGCSDRILDLIRLPQWTLTT